MRAMFFSSFIMFIILSVQLCRGDNLQTIQDDFRERPQPKAIRMAILGDISYVNQLKQDSVDAGKPIKVGLTFGFPMGDIRLDYKIDKSLTEGGDSENIVRDNFGSTLINMVSSLNSYLSFSFRGYLPRSRIFHIYSTDAIRFYWGPCYELMSGNIEYYTSNDPDTIAGSALTYSAFAASLVSHVWGARYSVDISNRDYRIKIEPTIGITAKRISGNLANYPNARQRMFNTTDRLFGGFYLNSLLYINSFYASHTLTAVSSDEHIENFSKIQQVFGVGFSAELPILLGKVIENAINDEMRAEAKRRRMVEKTKEANEHFKIMEGRNLEREAEAEILQGKAMLLKDNADSVKAEEKIKHARKELGKARKMLTDAHSIEEHQLIMQQREKEARKAARKARGALRKASRKKRRNRPDADKYVKEAIAAAQTAAEKARDAKKSAEMSVAKAESIIKVQQGDSVHASDSLHAKHTENKITATIDSESKAGLPEEAAGTGSNQTTEQAQPAASSSQNSDDTTPGKALPVDENIEPHDIATDGSEITNVGEE